MHQELQLELVSTDETGWMHARVPGGGGQELLLDGGGSATHGKEGVMAGSSNSMNHDCLAG